MLEHAEYLRVELAGVRQALDETLRHRFHGKYQDFYSECDRRLTWAENAIRKSAALPGTGALVSAQLNEISDLITRMERSHLEEFAWPFAERLREVAWSVCSGPQGLIPARHPIFFFTAEGGMASYSVLVNETASNPNRREIYPVIFPRSLKDHVLLHVVLGHEIGHIAYRTMPTGEKFGELAMEILQGSGLGTPADLNRWCTNNLVIKNQTPEDALRARHGLWAEEFFCDLFGLISMGPSFIPALIALLGPRTEYEYPFVPTHPPLDARLALLGYAADVLGMQYSKHDDPVHRLTIAGSLESAFIEQLRSAKETPAGKVVNRDSAFKAAKGIRDYCNELDGVTFPHPDAALMAHLVEQLGQSLPPSSKRRHLDPKALGHDLDAIDFRHILYAGWLHWSRLDTTRSEMDLHWISQLCSKAILHQEGIAFWNQNRNRVRTGA